MDFQAFLVKAIVTVAIGAFFLILNEIVFRRLYKEHEKTHLLFLQRFIRVFILALVVMLIITEYWGLTRLAEIIAGSAVVISGIIAFAAQSVLRDFFAGLMISIYRPFEVGDRLTLTLVEKPCVVEELTMRHTVLKTMDGIRYVIPNSEIGSAVITNTSYRQRLRGTFITVPVSYDTNIGQAIHLMRQAVRECPRTCPNNQANHDLDGYGDVYLMGFDSSSLRLETVIWTEPETDNFLACSEVRTAIIQKFRKNNVEIPYNYMNIIEKEENYREDMLRAAEEVDFKLKKRNTRIKTDPVVLHDDTESVQRVLEKVERYAHYYAMSEKNRNTLQLLSEDLLTFAKEVTNEPGGKYWIEGNRNKVHVCVRKHTDLDSGAEKELLDFSSSGKNEAGTGFAGQIRLMLRNHAAGDAKTTVSYAKYKESGDFAEGELEKKILTSIADDIKVSIKKNDVVLMVVKSFPKA